MSDAYDDVELPYPDAKITAVLCGGGPCIYVTNPGVNAAMMNSFILNHIVPNVRKRLPESACLVLGKAVMWLITSSIADVYVPVEVKDQVLSDWAHVCGGDLDVDGIDVKKVILYRNLQWWYYGAIMEQYLSTQLGRRRVKEVVARGIVELECKVHTQIFEIR